MRYKIDKAYVSRLTEDLLYEHWGVDEDEVVLLTGADSMERKELEEMVLWLLRDCWKPSRRPLRASHRAKLPYCP